MTNHATIGHRLVDIIYLAEKTAPIDEGDWKCYAESVLRIIAAQARKAQIALDACGEQACKED